jgi:hypothetical protein
MMNESIFSFIVSFSGASLLLINEIFIGTLVGDCITLLNFLRKKLLRIWHERVTKV